MRSLRILFAGALSLLLLVGLVPHGSAQSAQVVATDLNMNVDLQGEGTTLDRGEQTQGFVQGAVCYQQGGFNPTGGKFVLTLSVVTAPDWLDVRITGGDTQDWAPPTGPELQPEGDCVDFDDFSLRVTALETAPYDGTGNIEFAIDVTQEGDVGTYALPAPQTASGSIKISPDPGTDFELPDPDATPPPPPPPTEEGPAAPFLVVVLVALVAARLRRRA